MANWLVDLKSVRFIIVYESVLARSTRANELQGTHDLGFNVCSVSYIVVLRLIVNKNVRFSIFYGGEKGGG